MLYPFDSLRLWSVPVLRCDVASEQVINGDGTTDPMVQKTLPLQSSSQLCVTHEFDVDAMQNKSTATTPVELPLGVDGAVSLTNLTTVSTMHAHLGLPNEVIPTVQELCNDATMVPNRCLPMIGRPSLHRSPMRYR